MSEQARAHTTFFLKRAGRLLILLFPLLFSAQQRIQDIDSLRRALSAAPNDTSRVLLLRKLALQMTAGNPDSALPYTIQAANIAAKTGWKKGIAFTNTDMGLYHAARYNYHTADSFYDKAFEIYQNLHDRYGTAALLANRSTLYTSKGDYAAALEQAFAALTILEDLDDSNTRAMVLENVGTVYLRQRRYNKTIEYYTLALEQYEKTGDRRGIARNLGNRGIVLNAHGDYAGALINHRKAYELNRELGNLQSQQINLANLGITYYNLKNYDEALSNHLKALTISRERNDRGGIAINLGNTGELYLAIARNLGDSQKYKAPLDSAIAYLGAAVDLSRQLSYTGPCLEFSKYLSDALIWAGDHKKAFLVFRTAAAIEDSIYTEESKLKIAELEKKREIDLKDRDIKLKALQLDLEKLEAKNKRNERLLFVFFIVLLLVLLVLLYRKLKLKSERHKNIMSDIARVQSHEVRAPLARILGLIFLIKKENLDNENKEILDYLRQSADELDAVIKKTVARTGT